MDEISKELIKEKDEEIRELNREIGRLQHLLEAFTDEKRIVRS